MILSVENLGCISHPRYALMNSYGCCWDDETQEFVETGGTLYHQVNDATSKMRGILLTEHGQKPVRRFIAPVSLELFCDYDIDQATIEDWCLKATRLILHPEQGLGPGNCQSVGLVSINWGKLEELGAEDDQ